jgi:hypothetical protein
MVERSRHVLARPSLLFALALAVPVELLASIRSALGDHHAADRASYRSG